MASIKLKGDTSGEITISAPAVAGTTTLTLPATSSTLATQNALGVRNLIINGDMRIAQRGASSDGSSAYLIDRWKKQSSTPASATMSQSTDAPDGFAYSLKTEMSGSSSFIQLGQAIELKNITHALGKQVILSFYYKSDVSVTSRIRTRTDIEDASTLFSAVSLSTKALSASASWVKETHLFTIPSNTKAISVEFNTGALVSGNYFYFTGVQLEVGDTATPFEHRPYDMELARCQRYLYRWDSTANVYARVQTGVIFNANSVQVQINLPVAMRSAPTLESYSAASTYRILSAGSAFTPSSVTSTESTNLVAGMNFDFTGGTGGNCAWVSSANTTSAYFNLSAEL